MQAEKKPKGKYWIIGGPVLIAIVIVVLAGCRPRLGQATAVPSSGTTVTAFLGNLSASSTASGQVTPRREASLSVQAPGRVEQVNVRVGDSVQAGDTLVQLETAGLALNVATAELNLRLKETNLAALREAPSAAEIAAAEASVASAQANLDDLAAGSTEAEIAASEANLRASQASLWSASAELGSVQNSIEPSQIQAAQAALLSAQISQRNAREVNQADPTQETHDAMLEADRAVAQAQAQLDTLLAGPDAGTLGGAQGSVASAAARVDSSQANLGAQLAGPTTAQVAAAESQSAQAEATLADLLAGPSEEEVAAAEADLEQARLSLADAQEALAKATVRAPFAGVVTAVYVSEGEFAGGLVVDLVDDSSLEVVLEVDEVDVGELTVGQPASINLEAWPDVEIEGEVTAIAPSATTSPGSSLVTYQVRLGLGATELPVRDGMTANARLFTSQREGVLLVPNQAIQVDRQAGKYHVNLVVGDSAQEVEVKVGLHDDQNTQITDGLQAGDQLLVDDTPANPFGAGSANGFFGDMREQD